jgi:hypothetical protein
MLFPSSTMSPARTPPECIERSPETARMTDVLPAPFGPSSATTPFSGTVNETPRTASETP